VDTVFLTGASGFVGGHVAEHLIAAGYRVRALARVGRHLPDGCEPVHGDLVEAGALTESLRGCRYLIHCAALYSLAHRDRAAIAHVNVAGTASLLDAAHVAGVERAVVTSSSAAVGPARNGKPADETQWARAHGGGYHDSKLLQERAAFAARIPVVSILPTAPVGPGDRKPTPTGKMIVDFARGKMFGRPPGDGGMNVVAVEDVARAHVVALERGRTGERYLIGGANLRFEDLWQKLARATGQPAPTFHVPKALALAAAYVDEARSRITHSAPSIPIEGVHMSTESMYADSARAIRELDHRPSDVDAALDRAVAWFRTNGYV